MIWKCLKMRQQHQPENIYLNNFENFWNMFNDSKPIMLETDPRIQVLEGVLRYFREWKASLTGQYRTKSEQAKHFIAWQTKFDLEVRSICQFSAIQPPISKWHDIKRAHVLTLIRWHHHKTSGRHGVGEKGRKLQTTNHSLEPKTRSLAEKNNIRQLLSFNVYLFLNYFTIWSILYDRRQKL